MLIDTRPLLIVTVYQIHWISYPPVGKYEQLSDSFCDTRRIRLKFSIWASLQTNQFLNFELRVRHHSTRHSHLINAIRRPTSEVSYALSSRLTIAHLPSEKYGLHYKYGVPQERRRTVNPLRGKNEFLANETIKVNPNGGNQGGIPEKESTGIANNKSDPNGRQKELVPRRPRGNSNKNPRGSNYAVP